MPEYQQVEHENQDIPRIEGVHAWVVVAVYTVEPEPTPGGRTYKLDGTNLHHIQGPGCCHCEKKWTPEIAETRCEP